MLHYVVVRHEKEFAGTLGSSVFAALVEVCFLVIFGACLYFVSVILRTLADVPACCAVVLQFNVAVCAHDVWSLRGDNCPVAAPQRWDTGPPHHSRLSSQSGIRVKFHSCRPPPFDWFNIWSKFLGPCRASMLKVCLDGTKSCCCVSALRVIAD